MSGSTLTPEPVASKEQWSPLTLADLLARLGGVAPERVWFPPHPGNAVEEDVEFRPNGERHLFELVDGVLVEKSVDFYGSLLSSILCAKLEDYRDQNDAGFPLPGSAPLRLRAGNVRMPDASFVRWDHFPGRLLPNQPVLPVPPDLAVEILNPGNTAAEMDRKLREYFAAGTQMAWYVYPETRTVRVYTSPESFTTLTESDTLTGEPLLPGFRLPIHDWFERAGRRAPKAE